MEWSSLEHAFGEASDLAELIDIVSVVGGQDQVEALRAIEERVLPPNGLYSATAPTITALFASLSGGDAALATCMRLSSWLERLRPAFLNARADGSPSDLLDCDVAFQAGVGKLRSLRTSDNTLLRAWVVHLLSLIDGGDDFAKEELASLASEDRAEVYMTSAIALMYDLSPSAPIEELLTRWLSDGGARRKAAAMAWAQTRGNAQQPERIPDAVFEALLEMAVGERWETWEACPARQLGFFADLAMNLLVSGYPRADRSLPALLGLLDRCFDDEIGRIGPLALKVLYQSAPYPGAPALEGLTPLQQENLARLAHTPRAWEQPDDLAIALSDLDLPLNPEAMLIFLGRSTDGLVPPDLPVTGVSHDGDFLHLTLGSGLGPDEIRKRMKD